MPRGVSQPYLNRGDLRPVAHVAQGVWGKRLLLVNVYLIREDDRFLLVDAGLGGTRGLIKSWVERHTGGRKPAGILLTHGHFDHVGALPELAREWDVPVWAHALEQPYLTGQASYQAADPAVGRGLMSWLSPLYPKGPIQLQGHARELPANGSIPGFAQWRAIPTPGHAPGHVSLYREQDGVLLAGDAFNTTKQESLWHVLTQRFHLEGPPAYFTPDWKQAASSVERLAGLHVNVAAVGHGRALHGAMAMRCLAHLARSFAELGVPRQGRYVNKLNPAAA